jgi:biotin carboxyl carrier protein
MPGTIIRVAVNIGDTVKTSQAVVLLEAMKMENEIVSPVDGKVLAIHTTQGASVNTGDLLVSIG